MHTNETTKDFFIEVSNVKYNPSDFLELYDKYELEMYFDKDGKRFGLELCYDLELLHEPVVQHYANVFKDCGLRFGLEHPSDNSSHSGVAGYQLVRSQLQTPAGPCAIHKDNFRSANITFPLTSPQHINWYDDEEGNGLYVHDYKNTIVVCNVGNAWHNVDISDEPRLQFQFDCYADWNTITNASEML